MVDSDRLGVPFAAVLRHIEASSFAKLALVIGNAAPAASSPESPRLTRWLRYGLDSKMRGRIAYSKYSNWDRRRTNEEEPAAGAEVDCSEMFAGLPRINVVPLQKGFVDRFPPEAVEAIKAHDLDVILRFGFRILRGPILDAARYGIWSYHHGDGDRFRGAPPAFWELVEREHLSGAMLQVLTENLDDGLVLAKTLCPTRFGISVHKNALAPYQAAEPLVIQKLHQLHERGWGDVQASAPPKQPYQGRREIYRMPKVGELGRFLAREVIDHGLKKLKIRPMLGDGYWRTAIRRAVPQDVPPWQGDWSDFRWLEPVKHFIADPQLIEHDGRTWLFVERLIVATNKAHICCAEVRDDGTLSDFEVALETPYHLSLPFMFRHDGAIFMIPEAAASGKVELFRAVDFPLRWKHERTLFDMPGLDTILHRGEDGSCYFFTSLRHKPHAHPTLFLFRSEGLFEPWKLHPASPLSLDARYSRNAGEILRIGNDLIRPSQDLTLLYGRQMHFHRITRLNPLEYSEEIVGQRGVAPGWSKAVMGTHTYSRTAKWEATDGYFLGFPTGYE